MNGFVYIGALSALEGDDKSIGKTIGQLFLQLSYLIIIGRRAIGVLPQSTVLIPFTPLESFQGLVIECYFPATAQYLYFEYWNIWVHWCWNIITTFCNDFRLRCFSYWSTVGVGGLFYFFLLFLR